MAVRAHRLVAVSVWIASAASVSGCASTPEPVIGRAASQPVAEFGQGDFAATRSTSYLIRPADQLSVVVFREPDLSLTNVRVGPEGSISVPMVGSIPAAGMTAKQFEQDVTRRLAAAGLKNPTVSVNITDFASHLVTVEGAVRNPGVYAFQPGARLSTAIALASGPARTAKMKQLAIFRETPDGIMVAKFDYAQVSSGAMLDPIIEPGDRIVLGTDGLSQFWEDFLRSIPVLGVFVAATLR